jgi:hypothetical protein
LWGDEVWMAVKGKSSSQKRSSRMIDFCGSNARPGIILWNRHQNCEWENPFNFVRVWFFVWFILLSHHEVVAKLKVIWSEVIKLLPEKLTSHNLDGIEAVYEWFISDVNDLKSSSLGDIRVNNSFRGDPFWLGSISESRGTVAWIPPSCWLSWSGIITTASFRCVVVATMTMWKMDEKCNSVAKISFHSEISIETWRFNTVQICTLSEEIWI